LTPTPMPVDGSCGATNNSCNSGNLNDIADDASH
jgi:hypothetical protein